MSNINEKSNFECKIFWNKDCLLPDDALNLAINIPSTTYEESLPLTTTDATEVFSPPEGLEFETDCDTAKITSYTGTATNVIIPSTIKHNDKTYIVTSIGENAFKDCENLTSISISDGVTSIGWCAFGNCRNLTSISIPNSVENIGNHAFGGCRNLTSISIPDSVKNIGKGAFFSCEKLTSISIPDGVTSIGADAFENCFNLTSISIPNSVTSIGSGAFKNCSSLTSVTIPNSVTSIGYGAFEYCSSLTSVTFENTSGWKTRGTSISSVELANTFTAAKYLTSTYCGYYYWKRS